MPLEVLMTAKVLTYALEHWDDIAATVAVIGGLVWLVRK